MSCSLSLSRSVSLSASSYGEVLLSRTHQRRRMYVQYQVPSTKYPSTRFHETHICTNKQTRTPPPPPPPPSQPQLPPRDSPPLYMYTPRPPKGFPPLSAPRVIRGIPTHHARREGTIRCQAGPWAGGRWRSARMTPDRRSCAALSVFGVCKRSLSCGGWWGGHLHTTDNICIYMCIQI